MKISEHTLKILEEIIGFCLIILFVYTSVSKLLDYQNFRTELGQSPLFKSYPYIIAPAVLATELLIAALLSFKVTRKWAMLSSFSLMALFTSYIIIILNFSDYIPCSCGGVLQKLGWHEHILFNVFFMLLAAIGFYITAGKEPFISLKF